MMSTGFGPTSEAVGIFEPVTITRSASAGAAVGVGDAAVIEAGAMACPEVFKVASRLKLTPAIAIENVPTRLFRIGLNAAFSLGRAWISEEMKGKPNQI